MSDEGHLRLRVAYLERVVSELRKKVDESESARSRFLKESLNLRFAIKDHRMAFAESGELLPPRLAEANRRLWGWM